MTFPSAPVTPCTAAPSPTLASARVAGRLLTDTDPVGGGWILNRTDNTDDSYTVSMTSGEGRVSSFTVASQTDGSRIQINTARDGTESTIVFGTDATEITTGADGTQIVLEEGPDPRFGMLAPIPEEIRITTPGFDWPPRARTSWWSPEWVSTARSGTPRNGVK